MSYEDVNCEIASIVSEILKRKEYPMRIYRNDVDYEVSERFGKQLSNQRRRNLVTQSIKRFKANGIGYVDDQDHRAARTRNRVFVRVEQW